MECGAAAVKQDAEADGGGDGDPQPPPAPIPTEDPEDYLLSPEEDSDDGDGQGWEVLGAGATFNVWGGCWTLFQLSSGSFALPTHAAVTDSGFPVLVPVHLLCQWQWEDSKDAAVAQGHDEAEGDGDSDSNGDDDDWEDVEHSGRGGVEGQGGEGRGLWDREPCGGTDHRQ